MRKMYELGRSMLEIIAILILLALLTLAGLWGFKQAVLSSRVNTMTKDLSNAVSERRYLNAQGGNMKPHKIENIKVGSTEMTIENRTGADEQDFFVSIKKISSAECEEMKKFNIFKPKGYGKNGDTDTYTRDPDKINCAEISTLDFYFKNFGGGSDGDGHGNNPLGNDMPITCPGTRPDCKTCNTTTGKWEWTDSTKTVPCGSTCCETGKLCQEELCIDSSACPTERVCNSICCPVGQKCVGTMCQCPSSETKPSGQCSTETSHPAVGSCPAYTTYTPKTCDCSDLGAGYQSAACGIGYDATNEQTMDDGTTKCHKCELNVTSGESADDCGTGWQDTTPTCTYGYDTKTVGTTICYKCKVEELGTGCTSSQITCGTTCCDKSTQECDTVTNKCKNKSIECTGTQPACKSCDTTTGEWKWTDSSRTLSCGTECCLTATQECDTSVTPNVCKNKPINCTGTQPDCKTCDTTAGEWKWTDSSRTLSCGTECCLTATQECDTVTNTCKNKPISCTGTQPACKSCDTTTGEWKADLSKNGTNRQTSGTNKGKCCVNGKLDFSETYCPAEASQKCSPFTIITYGTNATVTIGSSAYPLYSLKEKREITPAFDLTLNFHLESIRNINTASRSNAPKIKISGDGVNINKTYSDFSNHNPSSFGKDFIQTLTLKAGKTYDIDIDLFLLCKSCAVNTSCAWYE